MTEQDVHNTLHSFNVIKQLQTSGQSFEDFFDFLIYRLPILLMRYLNFQSMFLLISKK